MIGIIHPTDKCNLQCIYCQSRKGNEVMSVSTLYNAIGFIVNVFKNSPGRHYLEWHAAEPMMVPVSWYERAEEILSTMGFDDKWRRLMCSNYTLLTDEWVQFLKTHNYHASLSMDGDKCIHDHNRGEGTFEKVISAIIDLKSNNISVGAICALSEYACDNDDELYPFFKLFGVPVKINPQIPNTFNEKSAETLIKLYDQWFDDKGVVNIDPFDELTAYALGLAKPRKCYVPCGEHIFSVDTNGDVYPCSSFVLDISTDDYIYGNVNTDDWKSIWNGRKRAEFLKFKDTRTQDCIECAYNDYCGGGCSRDSVYIGNTDIKMASTCGVFKPLFDHIFDKVSWMRTSKNSDVCKHKQNEKLTQDVE